MRTIASLALLLAALVSPAISAPAPATVLGKWTLWYDAPAKQWLDAMPLGNGHIGVMMFGGVGREQFALNEVTMWSGEEYKGVTDRGGKDVLRAMQEAYLKGDLEGGYKLYSAFVQTDDARKRIGTHLPVGNLYLNFTPAIANESGYRRELDMERSVARVSFSADGAEFTREAFVSNPGKVLVIRLASSKKGTINFSLSAQQWQPKKPLGKPVVKTAGNELLLTGQALEEKHSAGIYGVHFELRARVLAENGAVRAEKQSLAVEKADAATILVSITTDFRGLDHQGVGRNRIEAAAKKSYEQLLKDHVADFQPRFNRVDIDLTGEGGAKAAAQSTGARIRALNAGGSDPALLAQFFQFGRYLTLAGSREDSILPLPLQGLWSDSKAATMGWSDDYHIDINTQQNYWVAEVGNLPECHRPLMEYIDQLRIVGRQSAKNTYGARGWCAHVTANAWAAAPFNHQGAPTCGTWQASHLWEHYAFTQDKEFLAKTAYPILKENAEFFLDFMITDPKTGSLVTCPAYSCENHFQDPVSGKNRYHTLGNTGDTEIVYELFREVIEGSKILGLDAEFRAQVEKAQKQLPPLDKLIHKDGRLMEWLDPAFDGEYARNHRHTAHLLGLFPYDQITPDKMPAVAKAARATLDDKLRRPKFEDTEWTRGNFIHYFARLRDGDMAHKQILALFKKWVPGESLLTVSWGNIFCLDGNTAGASGIAEMLLQSHSGRIELLPALPKAWTTGSVRGLRARGGFAVDIQWKNGQVTEYHISSNQPQAVQVRIGGKVKTVTSEKL